MPRVISLASNGAVTISFQNSKIHCETGLAIVGASSQVDWYLYGKSLTEWRELLPHLSIPEGAFVSWPLEDQVAFKLAACEYK